MKDILIGYDIGGTKCAVVLGRIRRSGDVEPTDRIAIETRTELGAQQAIANIELATDTLLERAGLERTAVRSIGISCGGPLDSARGVILCPPNLPGWENLPICDRFERDFGVPVALRNDADACALAEWKYGAGRGASHMIFLTFGTGMGAGLILNGRLYSGACNLAGEVGHVRLEDDGPVGYGKAGSFEGFCSGGGIARIAAAVIEGRRAAGTATGICAADAPSPTAQSVVHAARGGDPVAREIVETSARYLGRGLAILVDILNPEVIVIGSIFARAEDLLRPTMERVLREEALPGAVDAVRIVPAALGEKIGDYACLAIAASVEAQLSA